MTENITKVTFGIFIALWLLLFLGSRLIFRSHSRDRVTREDYAITERLFRGSNPPSFKIVRCQYRDSFQGPDYIKYMATIEAEDLRKILARDDLVTTSTLGNGDIARDGVADFFALDRDILSEAFFIMPERSGIAIDATSSPTLTLYIAIGRLPKQTR